MNHSVWRRLYSSLHDDGNKEDKSQTTSVKREILGLAGEWWTLFQTSSLDYYVLFKNSHYVVYIITKVVYFSVWIVMYQVLQ